MELFTPEQYERARAVAEQKAADAERRAARREERLARGGAMTGAERVRRHVAMTNELREVSEPSDPAQRESCRRDFVKFVLRYGACLLKDHFPSPLMVEKFLKPLERSILEGGQFLVEMPRGKGKTTFIDLCCAWALAFGHRRYAVLISATGKLAKNNLANVMRVFLSPAFVADFPEIGEPFKALCGKWQLCESQTFNGVSTGIEMKSDHIRIPTLVDEEGNRIGESGGSILFSGGVGGAIRGLNEGGVRPDLVFFDDIQKRKDAKSPDLSRALEEFVNQDAMGLFGHGSVVTALMAITPICDGDFAALMSDNERNPAWISVVVPLVLAWPKNMELVDRFFTEFKEDCARDDFARTLSRQFYLDHRDELNEGAVLLDPQDGGENEVDALHHVLLLVAKVGRDAFNAEYQMQVREEGEMLTVSPDVVKHAVNGVNECVLPPGTDSVVGFCDVNAQASSGLRYGLLAIGEGRVTAVITYRKYPEGRVRLFEENLPRPQQAEVVGKAVRQVAKIVAGIPLRYMNGRAAHVSAFAFDGGNWTKAVARACVILKQTDRVPFMLFWTLGRGWSKFNDVKAKTRHRRGDHMFLAQSANGNHIVFHADYWREMTQSLMLAEPLSPSSLSLFGDSPIRHDEFATEFCAERLVRKFVRPDGRLEWDWAKKGKMNHWLDVAVGCLVVASWARFFDSDEKMIDRAVARNIVEEAKAAHGAPVPSADRLAMERELEAAVAAQGSAAVASPGVVFRPATRPLRKTRFRFSHKLRH